LDGVAADIELVIPEPHCLRRQFSESTVKADSANVELLFADPTDTFGEFTFNLENGVHSSVHIGTGGSTGGAS